LTDVEKNGNNQIDVAIVEAEIKGQHLVHTHVVTCKQQRV
jgi:hypothetical protein